MALYTVQTLVELFTDFIFFLMPESSLEITLLMILPNRSPATSRKTKLSMAFAKS